MATLSLSDWFADRTPAADQAELENRLLALLDSAREQHPGVEVPDGEFAAYLAERTPRDLPVVEALERVRGADLYLACACVRGDSVATQLVDQLLVAATIKALRRRGVSGDLIEETLQALRVRLLVAECGEVRIAAYAGRGSLSGWLRATALNYYLNSLRRGKREVVGADDELLENQVVDRQDVRVVHMKQLYGEQFKAAFYQSFTELEPRDRNLLRHFYIDELNLEELAKLLGVSRATAHRHLVRARTRVADATQARLMQLLHVNIDELISIRRMVLSNIEITLRRLVS